ncbi:hypothetical protein TNCV_4837731 [Trichonephila clavipes]|nr:hypothetical protein TNCV_4837731 [Trichonephila clavipes]
MYCNSSQTIAEFEQYIADLCQIVAMGSLVVRASDSRQEGLESTPTNGEKDRSVSVIAGENLLKWVIMNSDPCFHNLSLSVQGWNSLRPESSAYHASKSTGSLDSPIMRIKRSRRETKMKRRA